MKLIEQPPVSKIAMRLLIVAVLACAVVVDGLNSSLIRDASARSKHRIIKFANQNKIALSTLSVFVFDQNTKHIVFEHLADRIQDSPLMLRLMLLSAVYDQSMPRRPDVKDIVPEADDPNTTGPETVELAEQDERREAITGDHIESASTVDTENKQVSTLPLITRPSIQSALSLLHRVHDDPIAILTQDPQKPTNNTSLPNKDIAVKKITTFVTANKMSFDPKKIIHWAGKALQFSTGDMVRYLTRAVNDYRWGVDTLSLLPTIDLGGGKKIRGMIENQPTSITIFGILLNTKTMQQRIIGLRISPCTRVNYEKNYQWLKLAAGLFLD